METQGGKFLTFLLGEEIYGIPIKKVKEILGRIEINKLPQMEGYLAGIIDLRGRSIPVVDLRYKLGMEVKEYTIENTCIIIIETGVIGAQMLIGILVDKVWEVVTIGAKDIEPPPEYEAKIDGDFLAGFGKLKNKLILIFDCDKILNQTEMAYISLEFTDSKGDFSSDSPNTCVR